MLRLPQRKAIRFIVQWLLALVFLAPGLAVFIISANKLTPAARQKWRTITPDGQGIVLLGEVSTMDINQNEISIRWAVGGWGPDYGYHWDDDQDMWWPFPGLPSLSRPAKFKVDGPSVVWSYDPAYVLGPDIYSAANHFTTTHPLNAFADRSYSTLFSAKHYVDIGFQVVDPATNLSLPIAGMKCDPQPGPALIGWTIGSTFRQRDVVDETLANAPVYAIQVTLNVHTWKLFYEVLMGIMVLFGSLVTLISTAHLIRTSWAGNRKVAVEEMLAIPFALGSIIAALRTAFPPRSDLEIFLNEAIYYPCFVLAVWCVMAGVISTRSMTVKTLKDFRSWGEAMNPFEGMTRKKQHDLEKSLELTQKEMEAEEALQRRMRSMSASSPVVGRTIPEAGPVVRSPEEIESVAEHKFLSKQETT